MHNLSAANSPSTGLESKSALDATRALVYQHRMRDVTAHDSPEPRPFQGVGELGRPRSTWNAENAGSNPAARTILLSLLSSRY